MLAASVILPLMGVAENVQQLTLLGALTGRLHGARRGGEDTHRCHYPSGAVQVRFGAGCIYEDLPTVPDANMSVWRLPTDCPVQHCIEKVVQTLPFYHTTIGRSCHDSLLAFGPGSIVRPEPGATSGGNEIVGERSRLAHYQCT